VLTNLSITKTIKEHGVEAVESILKEMPRMHEKGVWSPLIYEHIGDLDKKGSLGVCYFLKETERDNTLKARLMADESNTEPC